MKIHVNYIAHSSGTSNTNLYGKIIIKTSVCEHGSMSHLPSANCLCEHFQKINYYETEI